jgi:hypothetical protein
MHQFLPTAKWIGTKDGRPLNWHQARISSLSDKKESWLPTGCLCLLHACINCTAPLLQKTYKPVLTYSLLYNTIKSSKIDWNQPTPNQPNRPIYYSTASKLVLGTLVLGTQYSYISAVGRHWWRSLCHRRRAPFKSKSLSNFIWQIL